MSTMQRNKGAQFEREVADFFSGLLGTKVTRILGQARDGGADIRPLPGLLVECKRRKTLKGLYAWMDQVELAVAQVMETEGGRCPVPMVVLRADNEEALVLVRLADLQDVVVTLARPPVVPGA